MLGSARADDAAQSPPKPLPTKQEIIRDRFQRLEDRMFRLRQQLSQTEPDNADRLGRALERAGGLGLAERLDEISRILAADGRLLEGIDAQQAWLDQVDKVMAILLQRDSDNEQRKDEIARMEEYRERMRTILEQQRAQRDQSARASALRQLRAELDTALDQIEQEIQRQQELSERSGDPQEKEDIAREQAEAARSAEALAEQVERMAESEALKADPQSGESQQSDSAKSEMQKAGEALDSAAESMKQASKSASQGDEESLADEQERAEEALKRARDSLKKAKENLPEDPDLEKMGDEQGKTADATGDLADKMRQDGQPQEGGENQQGQQPSKPSPGTDKVQEAEREMRDAQKDLEDGQPEDAAEEQDRAIEALEEAQQALEDELNQLRKEDRQETLRDLESRFRAMTAKQRAINEGTTELDRVDEASFRRPEQLRAAELAAEMRDGLERVRVATADLPPKKVLFVVGRDPLFVAGPGSHVDELIRLGAGINVAHDAASPYQQFSVEAVLERLPEVIVDTSGDAEYWDRWPFLPAVRNGNVYRVEPSVLVIPGIRLPEMAQAMAELIHPGTFARPTDE